MLTRGMFPSTLVANSTWWNGPQWLRSPTDSWPTANLTQAASDALGAEEKKVAAALHVATGSKLEPVLDLNRYSSFIRVVRVTAWIKRFTDNARRASHSHGGPLTAKEVEDAETHWIKAVQQEAFGEELDKLRASRQLDAKSVIRDFSPYLDDDNLLRVGGRLQFSESRESTKHPVLLPSDHPFTALLIEKEHRRLLHGGICDTLGQLREKFWIIRGRQAVKKIIRRCLACRKQVCKPASAPVAPLPADRVTACKPFDVTGVDFAGPLLYRERRRDQKCYIALFTCAVTRAVHLELVTSMSTDAFLWALRRFISRRGTPATLYSDNAMTFKRAAKDLRVIFNIVKSDALQDYFANHKVQWKYIAERAAWWGGFWERLVRTVKTTLRKVLGRSSLNFEELTTVLSEVEAVVNSRPLTFTYSDTGEPQPLTPSHFLVGQKLTSLPSLNSAKNMSSTSDDLKRRWKYQVAMTERFWNRWRREYLLELASAHRARHADCHQLKVGDIVLLQNDRVPRHMWKLCRITETFPGRDGKIRSCKIMLPSGVELRRSVQAVFPLEF